MYIFKFRLKTIILDSAVLKTGVENMFRSEIGSGFEDPGLHTPIRIRRSTPPGH